MQFPPRCSALGLPGEAGANGEMRLPAALKPLRHPVFFSLFTANLVTSLGTWMQNPGAGWLMDTLKPDALTVNLVQAATILPVCLLAGQARDRTVVDANAYPRRSGFADHVVRAHTG